MGRLLFPTITSMTSTRRTRWPRSWIRSGREPRCAGGSGSLRRQIATARKARPVTPCLAAAVWRCRTGPSRPWLLLSVGLRLTRLVVHRLAVAAGRHDESARTARALHQADSAVTADPGAPPAGRPGASHCGPWRVAVPVHQRHSPGYASSSKVSSTSGLRASQSSRSNSPPRVAPLASTRTCGDSVGAADRADQGVSAVASRAVEAITVRTCFRARVPRHCLRREAVLWRHGRSPRSVPSEKTHTEPGARCGR